ncbi:rhodanese-like domain-containing protein [Photobacterium sp.]|uniref:rhodanese-like domain-containing protein n=1 Tax=Photobacterium sp. TaxID=660 RepID=UPI00299D29A1|nr:rhodanese-like domain-containing protein [Photobacterium sp.]MDX1303493.1 rhodanese-like domain-containing protein [Photobacterium sp.]
MKPNVLIGLLFLACFHSASVQAKIVTPEEFWQHSTQGNTLLVDVRSNEEFIRGHLPLSLNIPYDKIETITTFATDKSQPILLYCRTGRRADIAEQTLNELGYHNIYNGQSYQALLTAMPESPLSPNNKAP